MGIKKIKIAGIYFGITNFSLRNLMMNIIESAKNKKIPSLLIIEIKAVRINELQINFLLLLRKSAIPVVPKRMYSGSVIPNEEFNIILGSNAKIIVPTKLNLLLKNF